MNELAVSYQNLDKAAENPEVFASEDWLALVRDRLPEIKDTPALRNSITQALTPARQRINHLGDTLSNMFVSKTGIIELMLYCAIAQEPMLLFGEPGTAKTALVKRLAEGIGLNRYDKKKPSDYYYEYLLTSYTEPDELLGPVLIEELLGKQPKFSRYQAGMMPDAALIFLDEIFRANSAILNTLLSLINERIIYEAGGVRKAKTFMVFGAANRIPTSPELHAFYERFPIRVLSEPVKDEERIELFEKGWKLENVPPDQARLMQQEAGSAPLPSLTDFLLCNEAIRREIHKPESSFLKTYSTVVTALNRHPSSLCMIDDRKFIKLYKVMSARAILKRNGKPQREDLVILENTWHDFDVIDSLTAHVKEKTGN